LGARDVLVINDTRVIPARLYAEPKGQMKNRIELLLTRQLPSSSDAQMWEAWCKPAKRVKVADQLRFSPLLTATVMSGEKRSWSATFTRLAGLHHASHI